MRFLKHTVAAACLTVGMFASASHAQTAGTPGLTGSSHDFVTNSGYAAASGSTPASSANQWNASGQMCLPCHIPHVKSVTVTTGTGSTKTSYTSVNYVPGVGLQDTKNALLGAGLWNHALSALDANPYTLFTSWTSNAVVSGGVSSLPTVNGVTVTAASALTTSGAVDQNTKLCLGCHDGTVALASFALPHGFTAAPNGTVTMTTIASYAVKGAANDLTAVHPIGAAARWSFPTNTAKWVDPSAHATTGYTPLRPMADGSYAVGCSSCHDPHNTAGNDHMTWVPNNVPGTTDDNRSVSGSLLCENCHVK